MLSPMVVDVDDAIMHHIPRDTAALKLLTSYAKTLLDDDLAVETPALRHHVATHVRDLAALALGATREAEGVARSRGMGAARLRAAKTYIVENINRRDISIGSVAAYLVLTTRSFQQLFDNASTTVLD